MLTIFFNGKDSGIKISRRHLTHHTPLRGDKAWSIVDDETQEVVSSYTPQKPPKREKPTAHYEGSWASKVNISGFISK